MNCPHCASSDVARIQYGLPTGPPTGVLGGCVIEQGTPDRACQACGHQWPVPRRDGDGWRLEHPYFTATWGSRQGLEGQENQDAARCFLGRLSGRDVLVAAVFDGVGGLPGGRQASENAARRLRRVLRDAAGPEDVLPTLHSGLATGATMATVVCLYMDEPSAVVMHAGDSAAYADGWTRVTPEQDVEQALGLHPEPIVARIARPERLMVCTDGMIVAGRPTDLGAFVDDASYVEVVWHEDMA